VCYTDHNLALNKPSYQISTGDGNKTASQANDGSTDTDSCTRDMQEHPWWAVDLGKAYNVGRVIISNVNFGNYRRSYFSN